MKQDVSDVGTQNGKIVQPEKQPKLEKQPKPEKNLYEPYSTPIILYNMIRWFAIIIFSLVARIHIRGRYNLPKKGPYIVVANHLSWSDIPLIPSFVPGKVTYMAKEELFHSPVGWLVRFLGAFPVKRGEGDRQAIRAASEQLKNGKVFMIYPEGTRSKTHTLGKAHAGVGMIALRAQVPVIPAAIWGSENALKKFGADVTISYGKPILLKPKGAKITRDDINEATEEIMRHIAALLPASYRGDYADVES